MTENEQAPIDAWHVAHIALNPRGRVCERRVCRLANARPSTAETEEHGRISQSGPGSWQAGAGDVGDVRRLE